MIGVALLLCVGMLLTYSRGSWLGVVLGAGAAMLLLDRRVLLVAVGVVALALGVVTFMPRDLAVQSNPDGTVYKPPAFNIVDTTEERVGAVGKGRDLRTLLVVNAMPILADHLLLGVGPGWYGGAAAAHADSPIYRQYGTDKLLMFQETVDSFWLHILIEGGILGLAAFISILVAMGVQLIRALSGATGARYVLIAGILAGAAAMSVTTATTMGLEANTVAFMFWFLLGIGSLCLQTRPRAAS
jgi:O-Antigen ligase.